MKISKKRNSIKSDSGFAAIVVTLIVMSLVVLISIGFVRTTTQEQQASLDRQLSTQAFYAAETAINDAAELLKNPAYVQELEASGGKDECDVTDADKWSPFLDGEDGTIEYTCVLIDVQPDNLLYDSIDDEVRVILLKSDDEINNITINWQEEPEPEFPEFAGDSDNFPRNWPVGAPVLRVALTPLSDVTRDGLINNTFTTFLRPYDGSAGSTAQVSFIAGPENVDNQGSIARIPCNEENEPMFCRASIDNLDGLDNTEGYLLAVRSIYGNSRLSISADVQLKGEQAIVDATGKASDVLRRLQVRLRLRDDFPYPSFALQAGNDIDSTGGVCKPYTFFPGFGSTSGLFGGDCSL